MMTKKPMSSAYPTCWMICRSMTTRRTRRTRPTIRTLVCFVSTSSDAGPTHLLACVLAAAACLLCRARGVGAQEDEDDEEEEYDWEEVDEVVEDKSLVRLSDWLPRLLVDFSLLGRRLCSALLDDLDAAVLLLWSMCLKAEMRRLLSSLVSGLRAVAGCELYWY